MGRKEVLVYRTAIKTIIKWGKGGRGREKRLRNYWCFKFLNLIVIHITLAICCITYSLMICTLYFHLKSFSQILDPYIQLPARYLLWHVYVGPHTLESKTKSWIFLPKFSGLHCQWSMHHSNVKIMQGKSLGWHGKILHALISFPSVFSLLFSFFPLFLYVIEK